MQYVVMAYFSSSTALVNTLQVIWYWNQIPVNNEYSSSNDEKIDKTGNDLFIRRQTGPKCNMLRYILIPLFALEIVGFAVAIVWRTAHWASILAPVAAITAITGAYCWYRMQYFQPFRDKLPDWVKDIGL